MPVNTYNKFRSCLLSVCTVFLLVGLTPAYATDNSEDADYPGWEHSLMRQIAQDTTKMLVEHLQTAQKQLDEGDTKDAQISLEAAQHLATGIREMMPFTTIVDQVKGVEDDLRTSDAAILVGDLIPLYKSLEQMELYAPALAELSRNKLKAVETSSAHNDKDRAINALEELANTVAKTSVSLPIKAVAKQIDAALKTLPDAEATKANINKALETL